MTNNESSTFSDRWAYQYRSFWKKYVYRLVGAEVSVTTKFCDECIQVNPNRHDTGLLFEAIESASKTRVQDIQDVVDHHAEQDRRYAIVFNGNFNYNCDIQQQLKELYQKLSRHSRLFIIVYNPFLSILYTIASWLGLRKAPKPEVYLTEKNLYTLSRLAGYEVVRTRPAVFLPFYIPLVSSLINSILPIIPIIKRFSLLWVVVLRPVINDEKMPSLSIIIPARNEAGNISAAVERMPAFPGTEIELIFVEGNSTDDTWNCIQREVEKPNKKFEIIAFKQPGKGKNDAVRVGFRNAKKDLVTILDADLTMPPEMLPRFYEAYRQGLGDFINGSRLVYPMESDAMRPLNHMGNIVFCKMLAWVLSLPISDSLCGTKLFSLHDYQRFIRWREQFGDFDPFGDFEMLFAASELALGVIDIPVQYQARIYGETNISRFSHGFELLRMTVIGFFKVFLGKIK